MATIKKFYELEIWKEAHRLSLEIYKFTETFPSKEKFSLIDQIRRAASSVSANIAEGFGRYHYKEKIKFLYNARGSLLEVQNFIFLSSDLKYLDKNKARKTFSEYEILGKKINSFILSILRKSKNEPTN